MAVNNSWQIYGMLCCEPKLCMAENNKKACKFILGVVPKKPMTRKVFVPVVVIGKKVPTVMTTLHEGSWIRAEGYISTNYLTCKNGAIYIYMQCVLEDYLVLLKEPVKPQLIDRQFSDIISSFNPRTFMENEEDKNGE